MDKLRINGQFWLPSAPANRVAGILKFSPNRGGRLTLFGSLFPTQLQSGVRMLLNGLDRREVRILGASETAHYTLEGCGLTLATDTAFGTHEFLPKEKYYVTIVLAGCQFTASGTPRAQAISVQLKNLEHWSGIDGVSVQYDSDETGRHVRKMQLACTLLEEEAINTDFGRLSISHTVRIRSNKRMDWSIRQGCKTYVTYKEPTSLTGVFETVGNLSTLVSIATDRPSPTTELRIRIANGPHKPDTDTPPWVTVYANILASHRRRNARPISRLDYLFGFQDIGGVTGLCKWITTDARFNSAVGEILHYWHVDRPYIGGRIVGLSIAAERIYRWVFNISTVSVKLNKVFRQLATTVGPAFGGVVGDIEKWTTEITQTRHDAAHGDLDGDDSRMYALAESIYLLVVLNVLRNTGVDDDVLARVAQHRRWARVSAGLVESAPDQST